MGVYIAPTEGQKTVIWQVGTCRCSWGTMSELVLAVRTAVPVAALRSWNIQPVVVPGAVTSVQEAVARVLNVLLPVSV